MVLFSPEFCEKICPVCTRARRGSALARGVQKIEMVLTFGGCPWGRARHWKYGVPPTEPLPSPAASSQSPAAPAQPADSTAITTPPRSGRPNPG